MALDRLADVGPAVFRTFFLQRIWTNRGDDAMGPFACGALIWLGLASSALAQAVAPIPGLEETVRLNRQAFEAQDRLNQRAQRKSDMAVQSMCPSCLAAPRRNRKGAGKPSPGVHDTRRLQLPSLTAAE